MAGEEIAGVKNAAPPRGQFSLRTLLFLPVVVGVLLSLVYSSPSPAIQIELLALATLLPAVVTAVAIYGQGHIRAFAIGALFPLSLQLYSSLAYYQYILRVSGPGQWLESAFPGGGQGFLWYNLVTWIAAIATGLVCVGVRWALVSPRGWRQLAATAIFLLLVLSGPIVDQIGQMRGWWGYDGTRATARTTYPPRSY